LPGQELPERGACAWDPATAAVEVNRVSGAGVPDFSTFFAAGIDSFMQDKGKLCLSYLPRQSSKSFHLYRYNLLS
jgi:hypothetical protein